MGTDHCSLSHPAPPQGTMVPPSPQRGRTPHSSHLNSSINELKFFFGAPPKGMLSYCTCAQVAGSTKLRKKFGSSVACKTIGTFLSQEGHTDASGLSTNMHNEAIGCSGTLFTTAKQQLLDLLCRRVTEFTYNRELRRPPVSKQMTGWKTRWAIDFAPSGVCLCVWG